MCKFQGYIDFKMPDISPLTGPKLHPICQSELMNLFPMRKEQMVLKSQIKKRLNELENDPQKLNNYPGWFERLGTYDGYMIYSLRFNHAKDLANLRILFVMNDKQPMFIHAFQEKKGGVDYKKAIDITVNRLKES